MYTKSLKMHKYLQPTDKMVPTLTVVPIQVHKKAAQRSRSTKCDRSLEVVLLSVKRHETAISSRIVKAITETYADLFLRYFKKCFSVYFDNFMDLWLFNVQSLKGIWQLKHTVCLKR